MARSKEQWKAQKRAMHTQPQPNSFFQMKRPGVRPTAPPASSALFQLGRPQFVANSVRPVVKPDPIQMPGNRGASSGEAIDLTLDDDDDEDEPMGDQDPVAVSAASDAVKLNMLDGVGNEASAADMMVPLAEDVESDVDEEWPSVPPSVSEQAAHSQMTEDVTAALDAIRKTVPYLQEGHGSDSEQNVQMEVKRQQTTTPSLYGDEELEADVDEELPNQASQAGDSEARSPALADRVVQVEHLEDGEIFEEGAAPKSTEEVQQAILLDRQLAGYADDQSADARPHLRHKKQKKRGKKKTKRKLEALQMMHASSGDVTPEFEFERMTRLRQFADAPPPGPYTLAMMRSGPRGEPMNVRPVFQDPPPPQFHPGGLVAGVPRPSMRPPPSQFQTPPLVPPPIPYGDSQILRVNRQGSMEMLDDNAELPRQPMFLEPHGGFQYRSVSMSPPRPMPRGSRQPLQCSVSNYQRLPPPLPTVTPSRDNATNPATGEDHDDSDDIDLDSLRAAALRTKIKRTPKTSTPTAQAAADVRSSSSSSPSSAKSVHSEQTNSEPATPEIDELRLEILRSMQLKRSNRAGITEQSKTARTPPVEKPSRSASTETDGEKGGDNTGEDTSSDVLTDVNTAKDAQKSTQPVPSGIIPAERVGNDGSSCETDKSTTASEQNETSDKMESPAATALGSAKPSADATVKTPEFRPLTACSQSLIIRLSPEDFSPRKTGNDTRTKPTTSSNLQDAIKEMRRKIAEREKEQTNRLLESAAVRLSNQSSEPRSSPSPASLSSSPPKQLSPGKTTSAEDARPSSSSPSQPEVSLSALEKKPGITTETISREAESKGATDKAKAQAALNEPEHELVKEASLCEMLSPSEESKQTGLSTAAAEPRRQVPEPQERTETSGVSTSVDMPGLPPVLQHQVRASSDGRNGDPASESCVKKSIEPVAAA
jgi:hypothetical protein